MKNKLEDYVVVIKDAVPTKLCDKAIKELKSVNWTQHKFYNHQTQKHNALSGEKEFQISGDYITSHDEIMMRVWQSLGQYVEHYKFPWFSGWSGHSTLKYNKYKKGTLMKEHCDHITDLFEGEKRGIPTLSVIGGLNDNYSGGEFVMFKDKEIKFKKGELVIFPSNFLYPHEVKIVTKGTRYTYVSWVY
tara:strand:- start:50 stop:616 length:567 start_codon:yes stop_codon:yes gene_type:complete